MKYTKSELMNMKLTEIREIAVSNNIARSNLSKEDLAERVSSLLNYKKCTPDKIRSPSTNRCKKPKCSQNQTRDKVSKKCRNKKKRGSKSRSYGDVPTDEQIEDAVKKNISMSEQVSSDSDMSDDEEMMSIEKNKREVAQAAARQAVLTREAIAEEAADQKRYAERKIEMAKHAAENEKKNADRRREIDKRDKEEAIEKLKQALIEKSSTWADSEDQPLTSNADLDEVLDYMLSQVGREWYEIDADPRTMLSYIEKMRPIGYKLIKRQQELIDPSQNELEKLHTDQKKFEEDLGAKHQEEWTNAMKNPEVEMAKVMKNLKKTKTNDKSGADVDGVLGKLGDWSMADRKEIPCESFKGRTGCDNEFGEEYEKFQLKRCLWNMKDPRSQFCEVLTGSLEERLRITLNLSKEEFASRKQTVEQKQKIIYEEAKRLRSLNDDLPIDFEKVKKQVIKNTEDGLRATHESAKKIEKQVEKVTKEIINNKEISPEVKEILEEVTANLAVVVDTEKKLLTAKAGKNRGLGNLIDLESMLMKKQEAGAKTDDQLEKLGKGYEQIPLVEEKIVVLSDQMKDSRKNLMASLKQATKVVSNSDPETKQELSKISKSVDLLASITNKSKACQMGKIWNAVLEKCMCRDEEMENEEGICMDKRSVMSSDWYMSRDDEFFDASETDDAEYVDASETDDDEYVDASSDEEE
jgi:hypothetical protein